MQRNNLLFKQTDVSLYRCSVIFTKGAHEKYSYKSHCDGGVGVMGQWQNTCLTHLKGQGQALALPDGNSFYWAGFRCRLMQV